MADLAKVAEIQIICDRTLKPKFIPAILKNFSGATFSHQGKYLWLGTDELTAIERFTRQASTANEQIVYSEHRRFHFQDFIKDFDEDEGEVDVEGLDYDDGYLWIVGSHSSKRQKAKISADKDRIIGNELKKVIRQGNRFLLARIPVNEAGELGAGVNHGRWLQRDGSNNALTKALAKDEYLNLAQAIGGKNRRSLPDQQFYLHLPSKENGLDIEGLAARGNRVLVGLRGPVLRGMALMLAIEVKQSSTRELTLQAIGDNGRKYKRHFLDLDGLGVRELCFEEGSNSLLILAGPTMDLDGSHALFRLKQPLLLPDDSLASPQNQQLEYLGDIPHQKKSDRAEGLTLFGADNSILVVYDSPAADRLIFAGQDSLVGVRADVFSLA